MKSLFDQISRFQSLKNITSCSKCSSYTVQFHFDPSLVKHNVVQLWCDLGGVQFSVD